MDYVYNILIIKFIMNKKKIILFVFFIVVLCLFFLGYRGIQKQNNWKRIEIESQKMPKFNLFNLKGEQFSYKTNLLKSKIILYFNPECEHCEYEIKQILSKISMFKNTDIILISPVKLKLLNEFNKKYKLNLIDNILVLWDKKDLFQNLFGKAIFPTIIIYDRSNHLIKKQLGELNLDYIIKQIQHR